MTKFNTSAAIKAGLLAGIVFMMLEMALVALIMGQSPWAPPRMIAAIGLGDGVLPPPATFDLTMFLVAMAIHLILAVILALIFAAIVAKTRWSAGSTALAGLVFGLVVYVVNFYVMTSVFPWFAMARNGVSIFSHAVFGLVLGYAYHRLAAHVVTTDHIEGVEQR